MIKSLKLPLICIIILIILIVINFTLKEKITETENKGFVPKSVSDKTDYSFYEPVNSWGATKSTTYNIPGGLPIIGSDECRTYRFESLIENNFTRPNTENLFQDLVEGECRQVPNVSKDNVFYDDEDEITARHVTRSCDGGNPNAICTTETGVVINSGESITYTERCVTNFDYDGQIGALTFNYLLAEGESGVSDGLDPSCKCIGISTIKIPKDLQETGLDFYESLGIIDRSSEIESGSSTFPVTFKNIFCNPNDPIQKLKLTKYEDPGGLKKGMSGIYGKIEFRGLDSYLDIQFGEIGGLDNIYFNGTSRGGTSFYFTNPILNEFNSYPVYSGKITSENKFQRDEDGNKNPAFVYINTPDNATGPSGFPEKTNNIVVATPGANFEENKDYFIVNGMEGYDRLYDGWIKITSLITVPQSTQLVFRKKENKEKDEGINWIMTPRLNMKKFPLTTTTRGDYIKSNWGAMDYECSYPKGTTTNPNDNQEETYIGIEKQTFNEPIFTNINDIWNKICSGSTGRDCKVNGWPQEIYTFKNTVPSWYNKEVYEWDSPEQQSFLEEGHYVEKDLIELYNKNLPSYSVGDYFCPMDYWVTVNSPANLTRTDNQTGIRYGERLDFKNYISPEKIINFYNNPEARSQNTNLNDTNYIFFGRTYYFNNYPYADSDHIFYDATYATLDGVGWGDTDSQPNGLKKTTPYKETVLGNILAPDSNSVSLKNFNINPVELLNNNAISGVENRIVDWFDFISKNVIPNEIFGNPEDIRIPFIIPNPPTEEYYSTLTKYLRNFESVIPYIGNKNLSNYNSQPSDGSIYYPIQISGNFPLPKFGFYTAYYSFFKKNKEYLGLLEQNYKSNSFYSFVVAKPEVWSLNSFRDGFWYARGDKNLQYPPISSSANQFKFGGQLCNNFNTGFITLNGLASNSKKENPEDVYKIEDQKLSEIFLNAYNNFNYSYPLSNIIRYPPYLFRLKTINNKGTLDKLILDPNIGGVFPTHDDKNVATYEFKNVDVGKDSKLLFNYSKFTSEPYQGDLENIGLRIDGDPNQKSFYENLSRKFEGNYSPVWFPNNDNYKGPDGDIYSIRRTGVSVNRLNLFYNSTINNHVWFDETSERILKDEIGGIPYPSNPFSDNKRPKLYIGQEVSDGVGIFEVVPPFENTFDFSPTYLDNYTLPRIVEIRQTGSGSGLSSSAVGQITNLNSIPNITSDGNLIFDDGDIGTSFPLGVLKPGAGVQGTSFGVSFLVTPGTCNIPVISPLINSFGENYKIGDDFVYECNDADNNKIPFVIKKENLSDNIYLFSLENENADLVPCFTASVLPNSSGTEKELSNINIINGSVFTSYDRIAKQIEAYQSDLLDDVNISNPKVEITIVEPPSPSKVFKWNEPSPISLGGDRPFNLVNNLFDDQKSNIDDFNVYINIHNNTDEAKSSGEKFTIKIPKQEGFRTSPQQLIYGGELVPFKDEKNKTIYKKFTYYFDELLSKTSDKVEMSDRITEIFLLNNDPLTSFTKINFLKSLQFVPILGATRSAYVNDRGYEVPLSDGGTTRIRQEPVALNDQLVLGRFIPYKIIDDPAISVMSKIYYSTVPLTEVPMRYSDGIKFFADIKTPEEAQAYVDSIKQTYRAFTEFEFIEYGTNLQDLKPIQNFPGTSSSVSRT